MKHLFTFLIFLVMAVSPLAQTAPARVVLKVQSVAAGSDPSTMVLTLESGATLTVKRSDIDQPALPTPLSDSATIIRQKCAKDWLTDFNMRVVCEKQQQEAVTHLADRTMTTGDRLTIRTKCADDWVDDYTMRNVCEEQQLKALKELGR